MRGNIKYCPNGRQLAELASHCEKTVIGCSRNHGNENCSSGTFSSFIDASIQRTYFYKQT